MVVVFDQVQAPLRDRALLAVDRPGTRLPAREMDRLPHKIGVGSEPVRAAVAEQNVFQ